MSGIVGVYYLDGRPVDRTNLEEMVEILAHRGPDGADVWYRNSVGLGHRMLWTTPESLTEKLPLTNRTGDLVITADARIDNRDELITMLGLTGRPPGEITDSELILAAYEKWGEHCPERLLGAFAFALWDGRKQAMFCARDHFGVKPFYYYSSGRVFVFASEIKALLCLPEVPRRLNEVRVADYLTSMFDDTAITFYQDILRLPPGHRMTVSCEGAQLQSYWSLDPSREIRLGSDEAYAEAFRELFTEAVRCRLRSALPVGSLLSGGLDSSSITCVARQLLAQNGRDRLPTFSAIFDEVTDCDERPFINKVLAQGGFKPHYVHGDQLGPLTDLDRVLWHQDEAFYAPNLFMTWRLYGSAKERGMRVLLDGFDGDTTVSHGFGYLKELARAGRWLTLAVEMRGLDRVFNTSSWGVIWSCMRAYRLDPMISRSRALRLVQRIWRALLRRVLRGRNQSADRPPGSAILNPDFVQRIGLTERYQAWRQTQPGSAQDERERHYRAITQGIQPFALEVLDKAAAAFSIEPRYPFWDKRLVEFCLALPPEQKLHRGWSRIVLRRAMADILPVQVQWRRDKMNFFPNFSRGLLTFEQKRLDELILNGSGVIEEYVDITALREVYARFVSRESQEKPQDVFAIWKAVSLALWLRLAGTTL
jgi:asparagine synthase (glutamine-hydrolysing)